MDNKVLEEVKKDVTGIDNKDIMPEPDTLNYEVKFVLSDTFISDVEEALQDYAYVEVRDILNTVNALKTAMPINMLNEIVRRLAAFPYKSVKKLMYFIETDKNRYWHPVN